MIIIHRKSHGFGQPRWRRLIMAWLLGAVVCLFMAGCGGGFSGGLAPPGRDQGASLTENEEFVTPELSARRLQELYAKSNIPGWDPALEAELKKWDHQNTFDVPIHMNKQVRAYLVYFATERKAVVTRMLARSHRYLPMIKQVFQEYGLPEDLAYLAMIESGFNPNAYSPAGAAGMWQFIKSTARRYGLEVNGSVDERRDPVKSTRAAARYLRDLYQQFGSWYLAAASYNCGEKRVERELSKGHKNFWELSAHQCLPGETKNYVPQMIAATIIAKNPQKFGFEGGRYQEIMLAAAAGEPEPERQSARVVTGSAAGGVALFSPRSQKTRGPAAVQSGKNQGPPPVAAVRPGAGSKTYAGSAQAARRGTGQSKAAAGAERGSGPYVASLFGSSRSAPAQSPRLARKSATTPQKAGQKSVAPQKRQKSAAMAGKGQKKKQTCLAMKGKGINTKVKAGAKKKALAGRSRSKVARTKARPKVKALIVSRAR